MSEPTSFNVTEGGAAVTHPILQGDDALVAPQFNNDHNTIRAALIPMACWRVEDIRFDFDSSFLLPEVREEMPTLRDLREQHKLGEFYPPLSVFGHADPIGDDAYNKQLSGRRSVSVYGLLTRRADLWEDLYSQTGKVACACSGDQWGARSIQKMLAALNYTPGNTEGAMDQATRDAIRRFQTDQSLSPANGYAERQNASDKATREKLFLAYMDFLCTPEFKLEKTHFLAQGADANGKGDFQGCGEFNPLLLFSQQEEQELSQSSNRERRNQENAPNRRVMVFLFRPGTKVDAGIWPCPLAKDGVTNCKKRFWSDGEPRRSRREAGARRRFEDTQDTFACRFYHRIATGSPCEDVGWLGLHRPLRVYLKLVWKDPMDQEHPFPANFPVTVRYITGETERVTVGENGLLAFNAVKTRRAFTLDFSSTNEVFLATPPAGSGGSGGGGSSSSSGSGGSGGSGSGSGGSSGSGGASGGTGDPGGSGGGASGVELFLLAPEVKSKIDQGYRVWSLPRQWSLAVSDWTASDASNFQNNFFINLDQPGTTVGTPAAPAQLTLNPHWHFMKFLYFDRKLKQKLSVPPVMVEGFRNIASSGGSPDTRSNWTTDPEACQCLPWVVQWLAPAAGGGGSPGGGSSGSGGAGGTTPPARPATPDDPRPNNQVLIRLRCVSPTFIEVQSDNSRRLVTVVQAPSGGGTPPHPGVRSVEDPGLNSGAGVTVNMSIPSADRLRFYDLPDIWKSRGYFVRMSNGSGGFTENVFADVAATPTSNSQPHLFSLDDMVLVHPNMDLFSWTPNTDRPAIFSNTFLNGPNPGDIGPYKPDNQGGRHFSYFSQLVKRLDTNVNYIADYPDWTRLVIVRGNLFDVFDKRTPDRGDTVCGARAAVRWIDSAGISAPGRNPDRPAVSRPSPFFSIQPFFEQQHDKWWTSSETDTRGIGRFDLVWLRCCDIDADGQTEVGVSLSYFRFFFNFDPGFKASNNKTAVGHHPPNRDQWVNEALKKIPGRWTGPDGVFNPGPAFIIPQDTSAHKIKSRVVWFAQNLPRAISHYEIGVFEATPPETWVRGYMGSDDGIGALDKTDNGPDSSGWFVSAHETGHGGSLGDEYVEKTASTDGSGASLPAPRMPGFDSFSPGSPYVFDDRAMMNGNYDQRARNLWHVAEWMRSLAGFPFEVEHNSRKYRIAAHHQAPAKSHVNFPLGSRRNIETGDHGKFDVFFYPLGLEDFSAAILPNRTPSGSASPFDGLLVVVVKMQFDFHIDNATTIHTNLQRWNARIHDELNYKFCYRGTFGGVSYNRALLLFSPRYWSNHYSNERPEDTDQHFKITTKASGAPEWDDTILGLFDAKHHLHFPLSQPAHVFSRFFRQMVGVNSAAFNVDSFLPIARLIFADGATQTI
jgi:hypothetical protein